MELTHELCITKATWEKIYGLLSCSAAEDRVTAAFLALLEEISNSILDNTLQLMP